jgi:hypothetical protein
MWLDARLLPVEPDEVDLYRYRYRCEYRHSYSCECRHIYDTHADFSAEVDPNGEGS